MIARRGFLAGLFATPIVALVPDVIRPSLLDVVKAKAAAVAIGVDHAAEGMYRYIVTYVTPWPNGGPPNPGAPFVLKSMPPGPEPTTRVRRIHRPGDAKGAWW